MPWRAGLRVLGFAVGEMNEVALIYVRRSTVRYEGTRDEQRGLT